MPSRWPGSLRPRRRGVRRPASSGTGRSFTASAATSCGTRQDAEDAFQATFLVLARRAGAIRERLALGGWLYRVAYRVATRRRPRPTPASGGRPGSRPTRGGPSGGRPGLARTAGDARRGAEPAAREVPGPVRPVLLAGKSKPEAAADLGWKEGTVSSRLARPARGSGPPRPPRGRPVGRAERAGHRPAEHVGDRPGGMLGGTRQAAWRSPPAAGWPLPWRPPRRTWPGPSCGGWSSAGSNCRP